MAWCSYCELDREVGVLDFEGPCKFCGNPNSVDHHPDCRGTKRGKIPVCQICDSPLFEKAKTGPEFLRLTREESEILNPWPGIFKRLSIIGFGVFVLVYQAKDLLFYSPPKVSESVWKAPKPLPPQKKFDPTKIDPDAIYFPVVSDNKPSCDSDGWPTSVKSYLRMILKEPGSFEPTNYKTLQKQGNDSGKWNFVGSFRAKNSFGARVIETWVFQIDNNNIVEATQIK